MNKEEVIKMLEGPLNRISKDKMEYRDYRKIALESPNLYKDKDNNYDLLLWYNPNLDLGISVKIRDFGNLIGLKLSEHDSEIVHHIFEQDEIEEINLLYFIQTCKSMFDHKRRMSDFRRNYKTEDLPKDFVRDYRLGKILDI